MDILAKRIYNFVEKVYDKDDWEKDREISRRVLARVTAESESAKHSGKVYFQPEKGEKAPEGTRVGRGERGGEYYIPVSSREGEGKLEKPQRKKSQELDKKPRQAGLSEPYEITISKIKNHLSEYDLAKTPKEIMSKYIKNEDDIDKALEYIIAWERGDETGTWGNQAPLKSIYAYLENNPKKMREEILSSLGEGWEGNEEEYPELEETFIKDIERIAPGILVMVAFSQKYLQAKLGDTFTVFRGAEKKDVMFQELRPYTLSRDVAERYVQGKRNGILFRRKIPINSVFMYLPLLSREDPQELWVYNSEQEVIVRPNKKMIRKMQYVQTRKQIYNFIAKQKPLRLTEAEAAEMGIDLPPKPPKIGQQGPAVIKPITKPTKPPKGPAVPKTGADRDIAGEIGRQLTPLGPYQNVEDIARDVREAQRIGGLLKPKPKLG